MTTGDKASAGAALPPPAGGVDGGGIASDMAAGPVNMTQLMIMVQAATEVANQANIKKFAALDSQLTQLQPVDDKVAVKGIVEGLMSPWPAGPQAESWRKQAKAAAHGVIFAQKCVDNIGKFKPLPKERIADFSDDAEDPKLLFSVKKRDFEDFQRTAAAGVLHFTNGKRSTNFCALAALAPAGAKPYEFAASMTTSKEMFAAPEQSVQREELRRRLKVAKTEAKEKTAENERKAKANNTNAGIKGGGGKGKGGKTTGGRVAKDINKRIECFNCHKNGHVAADCYGPGGGASSGGSGNKKDEGRGSFKPSSQGGGRKDFSRS
jgi:hypothetical protein